MKGYVDLGEDRPFEPKNNRADLPSTAQSYITTDEKPSLELKENIENSETEREGITEPDANDSRKKLWVIGALVSVLIVAFIASRLLLGESKFERLIVTGNQTVAEESIVKLTKKWRGMSLSEVSITAIADTLQSEPFIAKAIVSKELPDAIRVEIVEEIPVAMASVSGKWVMISREGSLLPFASEAMKGSGKIPVLSGFQKIVKEEGKRKLDRTEVSDALFFLNELQKSEFAKMVIAEINVANPKRIIALTNDGDTRFYISGGAIETPQGESEKLTNEREEKRHQEVLVSFETFWKAVITKKGINAFEYVDLRYSGKVFAKASGYER
ncbi:MAG: FtsQ-type POTRA domain-containing protein [Chloroherpetonaceae bacterium]|nr:FtsQ-type POTRA domain-containing protein [Chloroherpetonaceae bacterium]